MINLKEIENKLESELKENFIGKEYVGETFPIELAHISSQLIATIVVSNIDDLTEFNISPIKHGNIVMVSVTDQEENTIVDIMFTVEYIEEDKMIIKNVLCSIKEYLFEKK